MYHCSCGFVTDNLQEIARHTDQSSYNNINLRLSLQNENQIASYKVFFFDISNKYQKRIDAMLEEFGLLEDLSKKNEDSDEQSPRG